MRRSAAGPLQQAHAGLGHHQVGEGVAAAGLHELRARLAHRVVRAAEGQLGDPQLAAQVARQVQPLAEGGQAQDHAGQAGLYAAGVLGDQRAARLAALDQHALAQPGVQRRHGLHRLFQVPP